jgi:3-hydroxybutyrate dehydrogenase
MTDLSGKTALVTGSVQGIGLAIAEALAGAGARIAVHGIAGDAQIEEVCHHLRDKGSPHVEFFDGDLRNPDRIEGLMKAVAAWGGTDILVNNAGIQHTAPLAEMPREKWDAILAINLSAAFQTMQAAMPAMAARGYGRVINIASVHGLVASRDKAPYVAAKFGLVGLSRVAALEYAAAGTRRRAASR